MVYGISCRPLNDFLLLSRALESRARRMKLRQREHVGAVNSDSKRLGTATKELEQIDKRIPIVHSLMLGPSRRSEIDALFVYHNANQASRVP